jgi:drug/metabolite transporter (DMT)-like permease
MKLKILKYFQTITQHKKSIILILTTILLFSMMDAIAKILVQTYPSDQVIWARYMSQTVVSIIVLSPILHKVLVTKYFKLQLLRSTFLFFATYFFFTSLKYLQLVQVNAIFQVAPIFVTILSAIVLKEYVDIRRWGGVIFGLLGALLIIRPGSEVFSINIFLPAIAALCYASYVISTRYLSQEESATTNFLYSSLIGTILASILVIPSWTPINTSDLFVFSGFGLLGALGHILLIHAFRLSEASFLAPFSYMNLVFGSLWGFYIFDEIPGYFTISGSAVIISTGIYIWIRDQKLR